MYTARSDRGAVVVCSNPPRLDLLKPKLHRPRIPLLRQRIHPWAAGIPQPQQLGHLVERFARRIVHRPPPIPVAPGTWVTQPPLVNPSFSPHPRRSPFLLL